MAKSFKTFLAGYPKDKTKYKALKLPKSRFKMPKMPKIAKRKVIRVKLV